MTDLRLVTAEEFDPAAEEPQQPASVHTMREASYNLALMIYAAVNGKPFEDSDVLSTHKPFPPALEQARQDFERRRLVKLHNEGEEDAAKS